MVEECLWRSLLKKKKEVASKIHDLFVLRNWSLLIGRKLAEVLAGNRADPDDSQLDKLKFISKLHISNTPDDGITYRMLSRRIAQQSTRRREYLYPNTILD